MLKKIKMAIKEGTLFQKTIHFVFASFPIRLKKKMVSIFYYIAQKGYSLTHAINPRKVMFIPHQGNYSCNPKYIAEALLEGNATVEIVFSRRNMVGEKNNYSENIKVVEEGTLQYYQEIAKSKIVITNSIEFLETPIPKRKGQILVETWHGSLGIKKFGEKGAHGKRWMTAGKRCGRYTDYIISNSDFESKIYRDTFWPQTPILKYGHPRNDILFLSDSTLLKCLRRKVLEDQRSLDNYHFALYAPTFRKNRTLARYTIDFNVLREALTKRFGGMWCILVHLHPALRLTSEEYNPPEFVINMTSYADIQEIMAISNVVITDYSSCIYDFILTRRPGFIYATDIQDYEQERGFYYPLTSTPFPVAESNRELAENITGFDERNYREKVEQFIQDKGCIDDGQASKRVAHKVLELMDEVTL